MPVFQNIAAYKFVILGELKSLRERLLRVCNRASLKGTILLSPEGINLFVAGAPAGVADLLADLHSIKGLEDLPVKISESDHQPFNRMLVRIKREIIAFGVPGISPAERTSPKLSAQELKQWLDEGRPVTLLDTRNDYEVKLGTFRNALPIGIEHFRDFPEAVRKLPQELKDRPVVMFCTGGIRCEKAGPFMEREGFRNILQLDGGILKYFEECGGAHYDGECFVFDQRVGVDPALRETESAQCFNCLTPLSKDDQEDPRYVPGKSCPFCFKTTAEQIATAVEQRNARVREIITPLPGSVPYDNFRPITVPVRCDGASVREFLGAVLPHVPVSEWEELAGKGLLLDPQKQPTSLDKPVRTGERYYQKLPALMEPAVNGCMEILHEDEAIVVLNKPAPLPMHPGGRFNRNTLQFLLDQLYHPQKPRPAHRLDANTTGVLLITRARRFASLLQPQFARGEVRKTYLAKVLGSPKEDSFISEAPISATAADLGSRTIDPEAGLPSRTEFRVLERRPDGTTLLEVVPISGRTNQIRVHLWELGLPICGDPVYLPNRKLGSTQTLDLEDAPLCLHAWKVEFTHPISKQRVSFTAPAPFE